MDIQSLPAHTRIGYQKNTDFVFNTGSQEYNLEVGGKNIKRADANTIQADISIGSHGNIPLWVFGMV